MAYHALLDRVEELVARSAATGDAHEQ